MTTPILRDIPDAFETERLIIRAPRPGDGAAVNAAIQESLKSLQPWMPWATPPPSHEQTEEFIRTRAAAYLTRADLNLLLFQKETGAFVGGSGLHRIDWSVPRFEIGYWCRVSMQGQGYISEAVRGITRFAFETLEAQRLELHCDARNQASRRVAERTGFRLEAELRNHMRATDGSLRDTLIYALLPGEYEAMKLAKG